MNLPSSQITGILNKAPIKIQSLTLLIGFGSDRQPERQCLFWFENNKITVLVMKAENLQTSIPYHDKLTGIFLETK